MTENSASVLAQTVAAVAAVLVMGAVLAPLLRRLRQPRVIAEITTGIVLGPSLLGLLPGHLTTALFPMAVRPNLSAIAQVGILLFMFLVGWEMDLRHLRVRGGTVLGISLSSVALPFVGGIALATWLYHDHANVDQHRVGELAFALFVGTAMAVTAFPVLARIIVEHRLQTTSVGLLSLASAAVGDVLAWCALAVVSIVAASSGQAELWQLLGCTALYAAVLCLAVRPVLRRLISRMTRNDTISPQVIAVVVAGAFISAYVTNQIGLDAIFGAFAFGLAMPRGLAKPLESNLRTPLENVTALLMPIFFVTTGLTVNVTDLGGDVPQLVGIVAVACAGKLGGATAAARISGMTWPEAATIGVLMNTRGLTELIILNAGLRMGVLDTRMFTMMVLMALVTTAMAGPLIPDKEFRHAHRSQRAVRPVVLDAGRDHQPERRGTA
ncbi:cation:proton antiporter [Streptomyces sp. GMY02]|uniref:cation:proton antiporter domain-containing protein n=1 Tax=Streptomyces sp. GMY02 TaxID=1333528 RepID=UPI001C2B9625|nr:cation:proton antiporter [Streptomyces sp. GMY02]QXE38471.1 cation:proton antiporter [Streptomyces sp. GMY02]